MYYWKRMILVRPDNMFEALHVLSITMESRSRILLRGTYAVYKSTTRVRVGEDELIGGDSAKRTLYVVVRNALYILSMFRD